MRILQISASLKIGGAEKVTRDFEESVSTADWILEAKQRRSCF